MTDDPKGYYARLELDHDAGPSAIHTAYLRKARLLHPDVPDTGDAAAFVAVKEAYDVLANPLRRAAYDRAARDAARWAGPHDDAHEIYPDPPPPPPPLRTRQPRWSDLPTMLWAVLGGAALIAAVEVVLHVGTPAAPPRLASVPANAPIVAPIRPAA